MKIRFGVEYHQNSFAEKSFENLPIKIGRDETCQLVFSPAEWTTVSRAHAEILFEDNRYLLSDLDSKFGTFLNGMRVSKPTELIAGATIQLGTGGPRIKINEIEAPADSGQRPFDPRRKQHEGIHENHQKQDLPDNRVTSVKANTIFELVNVNNALINRFKVEKERSVIGRSDDADVKINSDATIVSRRHLEIYREKDAYFVTDLKSFNGTFLNGNRLVRAEKLYYGDFIQLGVNGPHIIVVNPAGPADNVDKSLKKENAGIDKFAERLAAIVRQSTFVDKDGFNPNVKPDSPVNQSVPIFKCPFENNQVLTVGRAENNNIRLDGLQISNLHARIIKKGAQISIEDKDSKNGIYLDGARIKGERIVNKSDLIQIGPYLLHINEKEVEVYDSRTRTRIDVVKVTKEVPNNSGAGTIKLLDDVSLTIQPNEFVGLLGPSGAGKSTFMDALNGMRPATGGQVLVNSLDLYQHLDSIKQSIGYVPQDDIIHRELTVFRTLYYVAKLRLSQDVTEQEIEQIVSEVMDVTGLSERRDVRISQLSGGQRKRVSIAVELITKPSIIYLDEPTSGLDPATEEKIMVLFRRIADSGRTVILTTHAMENVKLFDKIVLLMRGKLVFYGPSKEALAHVKAESFKDLYDKLEAPIEERLAKLPKLSPAATPEQKKVYKKQKEQITEEVAESWKQQFMKTEQYARFVKGPADEISKQKGQPADKTKNKLGLFGVWQQWKTLAGRYQEVLGRDKFNLLILFGQAPVIAFLTYLVVSFDSPRDFPFFMLALVAIWFGTSVSAREIIRERAIYNRERMVNLGLVSYIGSKLWVLSLIVGLQCILLFATLKLFTLLGLMKLPGIYFGLPQLGVMILTGIVGIAIGLFVSAAVKTSETATSLVPLILIPQILFSGLVGVPKGVTKYVGVTMPATWSFDEMKRLSGENVLVLRGKDEQAQEAKDNEGRGLYKEIEHKNDRMIDDKDHEMQDYRAKQEKKSKDYEKAVEDYQKDLVKFQKRELSKEPVKPKAPELDPVPPKATVERVPEDLSNYIDFLHPWGGVLLNPLILFIMFFGLIIATIRSLRSQDVN